MAVLVRVRNLSLCESTSLIASAYRGALTLSIGIATYFMMPPSPTQTKTWFRPNGWFDEREETIIVSRVLRDDPTKGDITGQNAQ